MSGEGEKFIAALDVGTTKIKCFIFDENLRIRGEESALVGNSINSYFLHQHHQCYIRLI